MRSFSSDFAAHLQGEISTLCSCWQIARKDGVVLGFTDHDKDISFNGVSFEAQSGFDKTVAETALGLNADSHDLLGALDSVSITEADLRAGHYDHAEVTVFLVNWQTVDERAIMRVGYLGEVSREDSVFKAEFRGLTTVLDQQKGRQYVNRCDADLGDSRCAVVLGQSTFQATGTVLEVRDRITLISSGLGQFADGWLSHGQLTWSSGDNQGLSMEISNHSSADGEVRIHLWQAMPEPVQPGDQFLSSVGCDKQFSTCKAKFANFLNFRGFPHIPGKDFALGYAAPEINHDGSPLVP